MAAKIAKVQIVHRPGAWGGYKVREISEGGRVMAVYEYAQCELSRARAVARRTAREHGAAFIDL